MLSSRPLTCAAASVRAPQMVAPTNACKLRSSSSDPLSLLALLVWPWRSTSWRRSSAVHGSLVELCGCAAQVHTRCSTATESRPGRPDQAGAAVQCRQYVLECVRSCGQSDSVSNERLTHPPRYKGPYPVMLCTRSIVFSRFLIHLVESW